MIDPTISHAQTNDAPQDAAGAPEPAQDQLDSTPTPNREAARYRTRLREVEAERDTLAGHLDRYRRREVERLAADRLSRPSDVWLDGLQLGEVVDEQGDVDPQLVAAAVAAVLDGRPQLAPRIADHGAGPRGLPAGGDVSWSAVLGRN